jgi:hypothetical protein
MIVRWCDLCVLLLCSASISPVHAFDILDETVSKDVLRRLVSTTRWN